MPFSCAICEETSARICVRCTKDTCTNHLCEKCGACSDCCACELRLDPETTDVHESHGNGTLSFGPHDPVPEPLPDPEPDPAPEPDPIPDFPRPIS